MAYSLKGRRTISTNGGAEPVWSRDGRELFYRQGDLMWVVEFDTSSGEPGAPRMLFEGEYEADIWTNYDISPDGDKFLMILPDANAPHELRVILNWFEELKRLVPTGN